MSETWHSGRILNALARYFDWQRNTLMPEYEIGGRADLVVITPARYLTEVEIKITVADWKNDRFKAKWATEPEKAPNPGWEQFNQRIFQNLQKRREHVSRFFYAIPETIERKIPDDLPEGVGVIVVRSSKDNGYDLVTVAREAVRRKSTKLSEEEFQSIMRTCYYRYWNVQWDMERLKRDNQRMRDLRRAHA
jgi:hypothetical protein